MDTGIIGKQEGFKIFIGGGIMKTALANGIFIAFLILATTLSIMAIVAMIQIENLKEDLEILKDIAWGESSRAILEAAEMVFEDKIKDLYAAREQKETFTDKGVLLTTPTKEAVEKIDRDISYYKRKLDLLKGRGGVGI